MKKVLVFVLMLAFVSCEGEQGGKQTTEPTGPVKVGIMGDSISTFVGEVCNEEYGCYYPKYDPNVGKNPDKAVDSKEKTWWWRLIYDHMTDAQLDINSSWAGSTVIHKTMTGDKTGTTMWSGFIDRYTDFNDPDVIFIHGGTNDLNKTSPLGDFNYDLSIEELNEEEYRSAYVKLVKVLQREYPGVQLVLIIGDVLRDTEYGASIKSIAVHFDLPYVDFRDDIIPKCNGSHPTSQGFEVMAAKIARTCSNYMPGMFKL